MAVVLSVPEGWHIYWENPGQSGLATDARLTVTSGSPGRPAPIDVTGPRWPVPKRFAADGLFRYGYEGDPGFVFDVVAPATDRLLVKADVTWLLCKDLCVTGSGSATATVALYGPRTAADPEPSANPVTPYLAALPAPFAESGGSVSRSVAAARRAADAVDSAPTRWNRTPTTTRSPAAAPSPGRSGPAPSTWASP